MADNAQPRFVQNDKVVRLQSTFNRYEGRVPIETLADVVAMYERRFDPEKAAGIDAAIQLNISGEGGGEQFLTIRDGQLQVSEGTHPDPSITVSSTMENFLKLNLGEANPMALMMTGKVKVSGSVPLALKFTSLFFGS